MKQNQSEGQKTGASQIKEQNINIEKKKNKESGHHGKTHLSKQDQEIADQARQNQNTGGRNK